MLHMNAKNPSNPKAMAIFRIGTHVDMGGNERTFTADDLAKTAAAYHAGIHEAPVVVGHPATDDPAWAWVESLEARGGTLWATTKQVDPGFADLVRNGRYKKISSAFYTPTHPANPKPGIFYLRHVGFLGAQPPAVKGMPDARFSQMPTADMVFGENDSLLFTPISEASEMADAKLINTPQSAAFADGETHDQVNHRLMRNIREHIMTKHSPEEAERVIPSADLDKLATPRPGGVPMVNDLDSDGYSEPAELVAARKKLADEFAAKEVVFAEQQKAFRAQQHAATLAELVKSGQLLPADQPLMAAFLEAHHADSGTVKYGEAGEMSMSDALLAFLKSRQVQVQYGETAAGKDDHEQRHDKGAYAEAAARVPHGMQVDPKTMQAHLKIQALADADKTTYAEAAIKFARTGAY
jgi:hypothetical protein